MFCACCTVIIFAYAGQATSAGVQVWVSDIHDQQDEKAAGNPTSISIIGVRNGCFSGKVVVAGAAEGPRAAASDLKGPGGKIPASQIRIRYGHPWEARNRRWIQKSGGGPLACLAETPPKAPSTKGRFSVWMTVHIPRHTKPGTYKGKLSVSAPGVRRAVPVSLEVLEWTLPDPVDYRTWVDCIQVPDTSALEYKVPLWSEKHWAMIARSLQLLGEVGNKTLYVPLIGHTNMGHEEAMVRWIKKGKNSYEYDFSVMEKYLDLALKHMGKPTAVVLLVWEMYMIPKNYAIPESELRKMRRRERPVSIGMARQAVNILKRGGELGMGPLVPVVDSGTHKVTNTYLPPYLAPESKKLWAPLMREVRRRLAARGLEGAVMLGLFSDTVATKEELVFFNEVTQNAPWVVQSHYGCPSKSRMIYGIAKVGYDTRVWGAIRFADGQKQTNQRDPVTTKALYGWKGKDLTAIYERNAGLDRYPVARWRFFTETCITGSLRGVGRMGGDFWYVIKDKRGRRAGSVSDRYPESDRRNLNVYSSILAAAPEGPAASDRFEAFREGLQECEARIAIERVLTDARLKAKLGPALAGRCQQALDERLSCMWKSLSANPNGPPVNWRWKPGKAGHQWFLQSGWQEREEKLYVLAGEVDRKLGITRARKNLAQRQPVASRPAAPKPTSRQPPRSRTRTAAGNLSELRQAVIDGVKRGRKEWVTIRFGRRSIRGEVVGADEKAFTMRTHGGLQMSLPWPSLSAEKLAALAKKYE